MLNQVWYACNRTIEDAIKKANNSKYGLAAGIVTKNLDIANTVSRSIRAGIIWINCFFAFDIDCPFGGYKKPKKLRSTVNYDKDSWFHASFRVEMHLNIDKNGRLNVVPGFGSIAGAAISSHMDIDAVI